MSHTDQAAPNAVGAGARRPDVGRIPPSGSEIARARALLDTVETQYRTSVVGQDSLRRSLLIALLSDGHILLESLPGLAKTTAARTLAGLLSARFARVQCTPDLLPSDITGTQVYDARSAQFTTLLGPVHANVVLLDEINRSSSKTQSAMLEAMQERRVTLGGTTYELPDPFLVVATQNPIEQEGTYPLPEAQLDRFLLKEVVGYPDVESELAMLRLSADGTLAAPETVTPVLDVPTVRELRSLARRVHVSDAVLRYVLTLVSATRTPGEWIDRDLARHVECGASPRAGLAFLTAGRAVALMESRDHVVPEDVVSLARPVLRHRLLLTFEAEAEGARADDVVDAIVRSVQVP